MPLTRKQRRLLSDIKAIAERAAQDHWNIEDYEEESRTTRLEMMRRQLIMGEIVKNYTFVDELLSVIICHTYFKRPKRGFSFQSLWRTKRFRTFAYHVLDNLYPLQKMRLVQDLHEIPKPFRETIDRINALRNALAHSFFPENRRSYREYKKVVYRDKDVFTLAGFEAFDEDVRVLIDYLFHRAFGIHPDQDDDFQGVRPHFGQGR